MTANKNDLTTNADAAVNTAQSVLISTEQVASRRAPTEYPHASRLLAWDRLWRILLDESDASEPHNDEHSRDT